ncbi:unnamed protein product [Polarella glacialis]|uniref:Uncharacterized protein n=1 Tax=Polarella glacialis TaxID=89957 RepID=A0A813J641_POLGL|nr:unnamed protein product [Polarella glacialis]
MAIPQVRLWIGLLWVLGASAGLEDPFRSWADAHGKSYDSAEELERRAVFRRNQELVEELNSARGDGAVYGLEGPWADISPAEFVGRLMPERHLIPAALALARESLLPGQGTSLPDAFDWTTKGVVAPVRDQKALGSCWAVSTAENIEGQHALSTGSSAVPLSAEQLVECDASTDSSCGGQKGTRHEGCADCGVFGGWPYLGYRYLQKAGGIFSEADWPYWHEGVFPCMPVGYDKQMCGNHEDLYCRSNSTKGQGSGGLCHATGGFTTRVTGWKALSTNESELAAQLVHYGPLSVLIDADGLQNYRSGVYKGGLFGCTPDAQSGILGLDHAVLLVGFGTETSLLGKTQAYWKLKNSWGTKWGEQGLFRLERGTGRCGVNLAATTAQVSVSEVIV